LFSNETQDAFNLLNPIGSPMKPVQSIELVKTLLYKVVKENIEKLGHRIEITNQELIFQNIR